MMVDMTVTLNRGEILKERANDCADHYQDLKTQAQQAYLEYRRLQDAADEAHKTWVDAYNARMDWAMGRG